MVHKKFLILIPPVVLLYFFFPYVLGEVPVDHWFKQNGTTYLVLMVSFLLLSAVGYWVNRKKDFGKKLTNWHYRPTLFGFLLMFIGMFGYYQVDAHIFAISADPQQFEEKRVLMLALIFLAAAFLVTGFCAYLLNLLISNYSRDKDEG
ncbi:MAG: hypothetical protein AAF487_02565 [Bacteroidota bacterium]